MSTSLLPDPSTLEESELFCLPLPLERFSVRAQGVLHRLNVLTVGEFVGIDWEAAQCRQLGAGTREELRQVQERMRLAPHSWLKEEQASLEWPEDIAQADVPSQALSLRARHVLHRNGVETLGAFLNFDWEYGTAWQLGEKTRVELRELRALMGRTPEEVRAYLQHQVEEEERASSPSPDTNHFLPPSSELPEEGELLDWPRLWPLVVRLTLGEESRGYAVLKARHGLGGEDTQGLQDLATRMGVSRERVRQIETQATDHLLKLVGGNTLHGSKKRLHPRAAREVEFLREQLCWLAFSLRDQELWAFFAHRYGRSLDANERAHFRLLLKLWNFVAFTPAPPDVPQKMETLWLRDDADRALVLAALRSIAQTLREQIEPLSLEEVGAQVELALREAGVEPLKDENRLRHFLTLWPRAEEVAPGFFQTRFEFLPSNIARVERILREWAINGRMQATIEELTQEIGRRYALARRVEAPSPAVICQACSSSLHLVHIGKSGQWSLRENAGETRPIFEIIEEALEVKGKPAMLEELHLYVASRRQTTLHTLACLIHQHPRFQRVGRGLYGLRSWGLPEASSPRRTGHSQDELEKEARALFEENNGAPIPLADLADALQERLGWHINTVRARIARSPWIETTQKSAYRLMAFWREAPRQPEPKEDQPPRLTKTREVQDAARTLLLEAPGNRIALSVLSRQIASATGLPRPQVYSALAVMPGVEGKTENGETFYSLKAEATPNQAGG